MISSAVLPIPATNTENRVEIGGQRQKMKRRQKEVKEGREEEDKHHHHQENTKASQTDHSGIHLLSQHLAS